MLEVGAAPEGHLMAQRVVAAVGHVENTVGAQGHRGERLDHLLVAADVSRAQNHALAGIVLAVDAVLALGDSPHNTASVDRFRDVGNGLGLDLPGMLDRGRCAALARFRSGRQGLARRATCHAGSGRDASDAHASQPQS